MTLPELVLCLFVSVPGLGEILPLILKHPEDVSERGDGLRLHSHVHITVRLIGEQRDLGTKYGH